MFNKFKNRKKISTPVLLLITALCFLGSYALWPTIKKPKLTSSYPFGLIESYAQTKELKFGDDLSEHHLAEQDIAGQGIHRLKTKTFAVSTFFEPSPDQNIHIVWLGDSETYQKDDLKVTIQNGDVTITTKELKEKSWGWGLIHKTSFTYEATYTTDKDGSVTTKKSRFLNGPGLYIQVPQNIDIQHHSTAGGATLRNLQMKKLAVLTVSGEIRLNQLDVGRGDLTNVSGDIQVKRSSLPELEIKSVSGEISLEVSDKMPNIVIVNVSGDIETKFVKDLDALLTFSGGNGEAEVNGQSPSVDIEKDGVVFGKGIGRLKISSISGDLEVSTDL